jgi:hypothetical protein
VERTFVARHARGVGNCNKDDLRDVKQKWQKTLAFTYVSPALHRRHYCTNRGQICARSALGKASPARGFAIQTYLYNRIFGMIATDKKCMCGG